MLPGPLRARRSEPPTVALPVGPQTTGYDAAFVAVIIGV
jgi:hypothetical protein